MRRDLGGGGARRRPVLDCFFLFYSRVFSAKVRGLVVISFVIVAHHVSCTPPIVK
jgi:hypothetical protein